MKKLPVKPNPWQTLTEEKVFETPWIAVHKYDVINPSGNPGLYAITKFKNLAIGVLPLDKDYNTWLVGQYRFPLNEYSWEIPEGGGNPEIDPQVSAARELKEETGIIASTYTLIQEMQLSNSATNEYCYLYLAQDLVFEESEPEDDEQLEIIKLPFEELYQRVCNGEIKDSLTVAAVLKVKLMLLEGKI